MAAGSTGQLMFGLIICFITMTVYAKFAPYINSDNNLLETVCQAALFFGLVSKIGLQDEEQHDTLNVLLMVCMLLPPMLAMYMSLELDTYSQLACWANSAASCFHSCLGRHLTRLFGRTDTGEFGLRSRAGRLIEREPRQSASGEQDMETQLELQSVRRT